MGIQLSLLSREDKERIHGRVLDILETVGVKFNSHQALDILAEAGCPVDRVEMSARIPPSVVERALSTAPHQVFCAATDPAWDLMIGSGELFWIGSAWPVYCVDLETRKRRAGTSADLIQCSTVLDALDEVDIDCPSVVPHDVHPRLRGLRLLQIHLTHNRKHFSKSVPVDEVPFYLEMLDAVLGDRARLRERPLLCLQYDDIEPLQKDGKYIDGCLALGEYNVPVLPFQMLVSGATTPVTLSGSVLMMTANFISTLVLYQLHTPGRGVIWGGAPTILDMHSGLVALEAESVLMSVAHVEMAKYYGVPCLAFGSYTGAKVTGYQAAMDTSLAMAMPALAGADIIYGPASLDSNNMVDLAGFMMGVETIRQVKRLREGMKADQEHLLFDVIAKMRFRGEYLSDPSTKRFFREEHSLPGLFPRESYDSWEARGRTEEEMALAKVKEILRTHHPEILAPEVIRELDRIMAAAERALVQG